MSEISRVPRSPELMSRGETALLVVDIQEKLIPAIRDAQRIVWNVRRLLDAAQIFQLPVLATEQYPRGLGPTVAELAERLPSIPEKLTFSCRGCLELAEQLNRSGVGSVLVVGVETHVCVQQTVLDLVADGYRVFVAVDAVGSRFETDHTIALRRMESAGATLTTTEAAMFEWCEVAGSDEFKQLSRLVLEPAPES